MQQLVFIHGATAFSTYEDFLSWLRTVPVDDPLNERPRAWPATLRERLADTHEVIAPSMPNKQNARYEEWRIWFERHIPFLRDNVVLAGWSQGGYFLVKYLIENTLPVSVGALYLIAAPFEADDFDGEDGGDFCFDTNRVGTLAERTDTIYLFHSRDDSIVPFRHAQQYQKSGCEARPL